MMCEFEENRYLDDQIQRPMRTGKRIKVLVLIIGKPPLNL